MILAGFAAVVLVLALLAIRDEFRPGESLHLDLLDSRDDDGLFEFPLPAGWDRDSVLRTFAEIEGL